MQILAKLYQIEMQKKEYMQTKKQADISSACFCRYDHSRVICSAFFSKLTSLNLHSQFFVYANSHDFYNKLAYKNRVIWLGITLPD